MAEVDWITSIDWTPIINFILALIATLIGVFAGYLLAVKYDRRKKEGEETITLNRTKQILSNELHQLKSEVDGYYVSKKENKGVYQPNIDLPTDCMDSIVHAGHFILLENRLQRKISHIYSIVNRAKALLPGLHDIHIKILENTGKEDTQKILHGALENQSKKFEIQIDQLAKEIEAIEGELPSPETN